MYYLYKITNILNGKIYIGQSNKEKERWRQHKYFAKNPEKTGQYIHRAMNKYGVENFIFEIVVTCRTQEDVDEIEELLIRQYNSQSKEYGYNIAPGGNVAWNRGLSKEEQPMYGKHHTNESKEKISQSNKGKLKPHSKEWSEKMSNIMTGRLISFDWSRKISESQTKFSVIQELDILKEYEDGISAKLLGEKYGCSTRTIFNIINRRKKYSK